MDKISKNENESVSSVQNVAENDRFRNTNNLSTYNNESEEKSSNVNAFNQHNDTVLDMPLPRINKVINKPQYDRSKLYGFYKSENQTNSRITWVQSMFGGGTYLIYY